jgi:hypothetical protein
LEVVVTESLDELVSDLLTDFTVRVAACENDVRSAASGIFDAARKKKNLSIRQLAQIIGTTQVQIRRALAIEKGGTLSLQTIIALADKLGLDLCILIKSRGAVTLVKERGSENRG